MAYKYKEGEITKMEAEIAPLWKIYHACSAARRPMEADARKRLNELSSKLVDYALHKVWRSHDEYSAFIHKADQFGGMFYHRGSVLIRLVTIAPSQQVPLRK